jgi:hypothetical protein
MQYSIRSNVIVCSHLFVKCRNWWGNRNSIQSNRYLKMGTNGRMFWTQQSTFVFHKEWKISWLGKRLSFSQERLCSMEWLLNILGSHISTAIGKNYEGTTFNIQKLKQTYLPVDPHITHIRETSVPYCIDKVNRTHSLPHSKGIILH